jgi:hypothetical protein
MERERERERERATRRENMATAVERNLISYIFDVVVRAVPRRWLLRLLLLLQPKRAKTRATGATCARRIRLSRRCYTATANQLDINGAAAHL